jgi:murein DD-endopeptidase MepM/ murein hydrolase activator NlpD
MRRLLLVMLVALAVAGSASAGSAPVVPPPSATPAFLPPILTAPTAPQRLSFSDLVPIWQAAGQAYGVPWSVLAAINKIESNFGQNMGPSSAGAIGWMQFMPATWAEWGVDANGDGVADPWNAEDAIYSAARYLAASGAATDISSAVFAYNHAQWYVDEVLQLAQLYANGGADFSTALDQAQQQLATARQAVLDANARLLAATSTVSLLQRREDLLVSRAEDATDFDSRLVAQKQAVLLDLKVKSAQAQADARRVELQAAQDALAAARADASGTSFAPGAGTLLGAASYSNGYVFPVAGGAGAVTVGHTHHDYPAADIAAPEGTQVYALSVGTVKSAWPTPTGACGIGFTIGTTDGLTWTYCHLSYLEPAVTVGAQLTAGQPVGLVGQTGHADGPHLHLQLQPPTAYPQEEAWFQAFAGTAFSWSDAVQSNPSASPVFAVLGDGSPASAPVFTVVGGGSPAPRSLAGGSGSVVFFTARAS